MNTLGIDNGTFNTACAVQMQDGSVHTVQSCAGPSIQGKTIPSFVEFDANGEVMSVGEAAKRARLAKPTLVVWGAKRLLGLSHSAAKARGELRHFEYPIEPDAEDRIVIRIGSRRFFPEDILRLLFERVKLDAENENANPKLLGMRFDRAVVSHPAYFNAVRVGFIEAAAKGTPEKPLFGRVETIAEPTAAAIRYGLSISGEGKVMAFDLGAGTLDVSILRLIRQNGSLQPVERGVSGHEALGGIDMDRRLLEALKANPKFILGRERDSDGTLLDWIETAKIQLSDLETTMIPGRFSFPFSRTEMEAILRDLVERVRKPIAIALGVARMKAAEIDHLVMVGGPTKMAIVRRVVADELRKLGARPHVVEQALHPPGDVDPMECVAQGAAQKPADLDCSMGEGFGLMLGGSYQTMISPGSAYPTRTPPHRLSPLAKGSRREAAIEVALKMPDADRGIGYYRYTSLGDYKVHLDPAHSADLAVELEISPQKALMVRLVQAECPANAVTYSGANLLLRETLNPSSEDGTPDLPPEILDMIKKGNIPEFREEAWSAEHCQSLIEFGRRLTSRSIRSGCGDAELDARLKALSELVRETSPRAVNHAALAPRLANGIAELLHLLRVGRSLSGADLDALEGEFESIKA